MKNHIPDKGHGDTFSFRQNQTIRIQAFIQSALLIVKVDKLLAIGSSTSSIVIGRL